MIRFSDSLYGHVCVPDWLSAFLKIPEFARLRAVRLSNVDSFEFKDFSGPARWEHGVAVASLAHTLAEMKDLDPTSAAELTLAGLLHDVATPPFAHTAEYVLDDYDHELETQRLLSALPTEDGVPEVPVYASQLPQFRNEVQRLNKDARLAVDPDKVASLVIGELEHGFLINGTIDLDNIDNVTRAALYVGLNPDRTIPHQILPWLAEQTSAPLNVLQQSDPAVRKWAELKEVLYSTFFGASTAELGRQALLQHLMRRALEAGFPRRKIIWNTDELLLEEFARFSDSGFARDGGVLAQLVDRYRLLESPKEVLSISFEEREEARKASSPSAVAWIERALDEGEFGAIVFVGLRRFQRGRTADGIVPQWGYFKVFSLRESPFEHLPDWIKREIPDHTKRSNLRSAAERVLSTHLRQWVAERPWTGIADERRENVRARLSSNGNWGFRLSRNEGIHPYPSTFVHAIPATLIHSLGLKGEMIVDPFGGTGQTAAEAIRYGGSAITNDSNKVASLVSRARFTFLSADDRAELAEVGCDQVLAVDPKEIPEFDRRDLWHHPRTLEELSKIRTFCTEYPLKHARHLLQTTFSAILTNATARRGKQHGFFADNTPLASDDKEPPYQPSVQDFIGRLRRNLQVITDFYSTIERQDRDLELELGRVKVLQNDARNASPEAWGVEPNSVPAVITSPPYLCMADYALGQRLSYYWLFPEDLETNFATEIGPRRARFSPDRALKDYLQDFREFARGLASLLMSNGSLSMVIAEPTAQAFRSEGILDSIDVILEEEGYGHLWSQWRPVNWHRNHGYARLQQERISVHIRDSG